jgi:hypothetical protein
MSSFEKNVTPVQIVSDDSGHWYIIPNHLYDEFSDDREDESLVDSGDFDNIWGKYRTGGAINSWLQLYVETQDLP